MKSLALASALIVALSSVPPPASAASDLFLEDWEHGSASWTFWSGGGFVECDVGHPGCSLMLDPSRAAYPDSASAERYLGVATPATPWEISNDFMCVLPCSPLSGGDMWAALGGGYIVISYGDALCNGGLTLQVQTPADGRRVLPCFAPKLPEGVWVTARAVVDPTAGTLTAAALVDGIVVGSTPPIPFNYSGAIDAVSLSARPAEIYGGIGPRPVAPLRVDTLAIRTVDATCVGETCVPALPGVPVPRFLELPTCQDLFGSVAPANEACSEAVWAYSTAVNCLSAGDVEGCRDLLRLLP